MRRKHIAAARATSLAGRSHQLIMRGGRATHVLVPVDEYEELVKLSMIDQASAKLDDPTTVWTDADDLGWQLAGGRIAEARKAAGLTQKQLGDKLGLPQSQISRLERNPDRTTVRTLKRVAKVLGVDISALT